MGKLFLFSLFFVLCGRADARTGTISLVLRADLDSTSFNSAAEATVPTNRDSVRYVVHTARVIYQGRMNERLDFNMRLRFDRVGPEAPNNTDGLTNQIDVIQINHKWTDRLMMTVGKTATEVLAHDGVPFSEVYLGSRARADIATTHFYGTGVKLTAMLATDQEVKLMHFNQLEGASVNQTKSSYGFVYKGKFLDKTLLPIASYHKDDRESSVAGARPSVAMSAIGLKFDPKPYFLAANVLSNIRGDMIGMGAQAVPAMGKKNEVTSYLVDFGYQLDPHWLSLVRYDSSRRNVRDLALGSKEEIRGSGVSLVFEYKPFENEFFRYHGGWTHLTEKSGTRADRVTQHFILGAMIFADFLM